MKTVSKSTNNIGGIARLYAVPIEVLTAVVQSATPGVYTVTLSSTDEVYDISAIAESISASEEAKQSGAGWYLEQQIRATMAKDTPELVLAMEELTGKRLIMIYRDQNDRYKLVGSQTESIRLNTKSDSGKKIADLQKSEFLFEGKTTSRSRFIADPFT